MSINNTISSRYVAPSLSGEGGGRGSIDWSKLLKMLIAVLTALAGSIGVVRGIGFIGMALMLM